MPLFPSTLQPRLCGHALPRTPASHAVPATTVRARMQLPRADVDAVLACKPMAIERVLHALQLKMARHRAKQLAAQHPQLQQPPTSGSRGDGDDGRSGFDVARREFSSDGGGGGAPGRIADAAEGRGADAPAPLPPPAPAAGGGRASSAPGRGGGGVSSAGLGARAFSGAVAAVAATSGAGGVEREVDTELLQQREHEVGASSAVPPRPRGRLASARGKTPPAPPLSPSRPCPCPCPPCSLLTIPDSWRAMIRPRTRSVLIRRRNLMCDHRTCCRFGVVVDALVGGGRIPDGDVGAAPPR